MDSNRLISAYKEHLLTKGELSPVSVERYISHLKPFFFFLAANSIEEIREVTSEIISQYRNHVLSETISDIGKESRLRVVKRLFEYYAETGMILVSPAEQMKRLRRNRNIPIETLTKKEITALLKQPDKTTSLGFRDYTILKLLTLTGITKGELLSLNTYDLDTGQNVLYVKSVRTKRTRSVPLVKELTTVLCRYLEQIRPGKSKYNPDDNGLFLSIRGNRLDTQGVYQLLRKYKHKAGITKQVTCTVLRNTYGINLVQERKNIEDITRLLGHKSPKTTMIAYSKTKQQKTDGV